MQQFHVVRGSRLRKVFNFLPVWTFELNSTKFIHRHKKVGYAFCGSILLNTFSVGRVLT